MILLVDLPVEIWNARAKDLHKLNCDGLESNQVSFFKSAGYLLASKTQWQIPASPPFSVFSGYR